MSHVTTTPHMLAAAAGDLASVGSTIHSANANAAAGTAGVHAPGGDAVSEFVSALFAAHAQAYQAAGAQADHFHNQFVQALRESAGTYADAEATNASPLQKVAGIVSASGKAAEHLTGNGAGTAQQGGVGVPVPSGGGASGPGGGNQAGGGIGPSGGNGHPAVAGGPQGANVGGGANGAPPGDGGAPGGATNGGGVADPTGVGATAANVPPAWAPLAPAAPAGPAMPHLATPPAASPVIAGGYPSAAGLAGPIAGGLSADSAAIGGLAEPAVPAASAVAASPAAAPPIPTAPKGQPLHQSNPAQPGDAAHHTDHDKAAVPVPLLRLRIPSLRGFRRSMRSGLRDKEEWREELREAAKSKPWGREELLGALGLRPPGNA